MPDKTQVSGVADLKRYLTEDRIDQVAFSVLKHLATYANGRSLGQNDLAALRRDGLKLKASGYRISPFEVESCLVSHPAVLEAAAVESPEALRGRVVKAFLVLRPGLEPSEQLKVDIQEFAKRSMAGYKYPRKIEFVAAN